MTDNAAASAAFPGRLGALAFLVGYPAALVGWLYLTAGHGRLEFMVMPANGMASVIAIACFLLGLLLISTNLFDRLPWHGAMPLPAADGFRWSRSAVSRLMIVLYGAGGLWVSTGVVGMVFQAWYQTDWGRLAVAVLVGLFVSLSSLRSLATALSRKPLLILDADGLTDRFGDRLAWSRIEKIGAGSRPSGRQLYLFLNTGPALGTVRTLSLSEVGLTAARFIGFVEQVAPQVVIERPQPPPRLFG